MLTRTTSIATEAEAVVLLVAGDLPVDPGVAAWRTDFHSFTSLMEQLKCILTYTSF